MSATTRKYYRASNAGAPRYQKTFLLRIVDTETDAITNEGTYTNKTEATEKLTSFLRKGVCSWLVSYND